MTNKEKEPVAAVAKFRDQFQKSTAVLLSTVILSSIFLSSCGDKKAAPASQSPSPATQQSASPSPSPSPKPAGPDLTEQEAVGDDYFSDAAFIGNSLMDGFRLFSGLTTCDYYTATSMSVNAVDSKQCISLENGQQGTIMQGVTQKKYGKIYIELGINEIGYEKSAFIDRYGKMLDKIIAAQPDCTIYVMGLTPVSQTKSESGDTFSMDHVKDFNTALRQLAADKGCYYMDLVSALADSTGYLPASETTDGIHFSADVYKAWLQYIKTHYVGKGA